MQIDLAVGLINALQPAAIITANLCYTKLFLSLTECSNQPLFSSVATLFQPVFKSLQINMCCRFWLWRIGLKRLLS